MFSQNKRSQGKTLVVDIESLMTIKLGCSAGRHQKLSISALGSLLSRVLILQWCGGGGMHPVQQWRRMHGDEVLERYAVAALLMWPLVQPTVFRPQLLKGWADLIYSFQHCSSLHLYFPVRSTIQYDSS